MFEPVRLGFNGAGGVQEAPPSPPGGPEGFLEGHSGAARERGVPRGPSFGGPGPGSSEQSLLTLTSVLAGPREGEKPSTLTGAC